MLWIYIEMEQNDLKETHNRSGEYSEKIKIA